MIDKVIHLLKEVRRSVNDPRMKNLETLFIGFTNVATTIFLATEYRFNLQRFLKSSRHIHRT